MFSRLAQTSNGSLSQNKVFRKPIRLGQQHGLEPVRVCRFASHVQLIAVGYDNGTIEVFFKCVEPHGVNPLTLIHVISTGFRLHAIHFASYFGCSSVLGSRPSMVS